MPGVKHMRHTFLPEHKFIKGQPDTGEELADDLDKIADEVGGEKLRRFWCAPGDRPKAAHHQQPGRTGRGGDQPGRVHRDFPRTGNRPQVLDHAGAGQWPHLLPQLTRRPHLPRRLPEIITRPFSNGRSERTGEIS